MIDSPRNAKDVSESPDKVKKTNTSGAISIQKGKRIEKILKIGNHGSQEP